MENMTRLLSKCLSHLVTLSPTPSGTNANPYTSVNFLVGLCMLIEGVLLEFPSVFTMCSPLHGLQVICLSAQNPTPISEERIFPA